MVVTMRKDFSTVILKAVISRTQCLPLGDVNFRCCTFPNHPRFTYLSVVVLLRIQEKYDLLNN